ncbi:hypothetical protein V7x_28720 [Crateriforma conspicua]|uniref:Uncharacterized protein n=1 Tax=Crateriforma conspicua TaxID=2527996 RepID=A0A5C6G0Z2_9PLAN|nr:hypothetical protein [Crateriforma conspicua]TWU67298.1 hypothetical protein V7x_28720 [Crateriforma conspicua]
MTFAEFFGSDDGGGGGNVYVNAPLVDFGLQSASNGVTLVLDFPDVGALSPGRDSIVFVLSRRALHSDADAELLVVDDSVTRVGGRAAEPATAGGLVVNDETDGSITLNVPAATMQLLQPDLYQYAVKEVSGSSTRYLIAPARFELTDGS